jgi:hypothetical protein
MTCYNRLDKIKYPLRIGVIRWQTNEMVRIAEASQIEEKVAILHTGVQRIGEPDTEEVTRTGGTRTKS